MQIKWPFCVLLSLFILGLSHPLWAFDKDFRLPLVGCHRHFTASGSIRYVAKRNQATVTRYEAVTIEVKNVPLVPGTVLVVDIDEETIGKIVLDAKQSGALNVSTETRKYIPAIKGGTSVTVRKVDGSIILW